MNKLLLSIVSFLFVVFPIFADIEIAENNRIANPPPGYCVWCSIEMLGKQLKISKLYGLTAARVKQNEAGFVTELKHTYNKEKKEYEWAQIKTKKFNGTNGGTIERIRNQLDYLKVKYTLYDTGTYNYTDLKYVCDMNLGAVVSVFDYPEQGAYHAIIITKITDDDVYFVDSNNIAVQRYKGSLAWFRQNWDGAMVVVYPEPEEQIAKTPPTPQARSIEPRSHIIPLKERPFINIPRITR